jgi:hypothetical protein
VICSTVDGGRNATYHARLQAKAGVVHGLPDRSGHRRPLERSNNGKLPVSFPYSLSPRTSSVHPHAHDTNKPIFIHSHDLFKAYELNMSLSQVPDAISAEIIRTEVLIRNDRVNIARKYALSLRPRRQSAYHIQPLPIQYLQRLHDRVRQQESQGPSHCTLSTIAILRACIQWQIPGQPHHIVNKSELDQR